MRKYLALPALIYAAIFALSGCSKSNSSSLPASSYSMSAAITKSATATLFSATSSTYVYALSSNRICTITGSDTSGGSVTSNFTFTIVPYTGPGTYDFDSTSSISAYYETSGKAYAQTAFSSGTITIASTSNENITGTFSGTLTDGSVVTNGKFIALGTGF